MANKSRISNLRCDRKVSLEKANAAETPKKASRSWAVIAVPAFALAFVALLVALFGMGAPVAADTTFTLPNFNFTPIGTLLGSLLDAGTAVAPSATSFMNAWIGPVIEGVALLGVAFLLFCIFILGPAKAIAMLEKLVEHLTKVV